MSSQRRSSLRRSAPVLPQLRVSNRSRGLKAAVIKQLMCSHSQLSVTGSGTTVPSGSELVSIPGIYNNVQWPDIWDDNFKSFAAPGPAAAFSGSTSGSQGSDPAPSSSSKSSAAASSTHATHVSSAGSSHSATSTHVSTYVPTTTTAEPAKTSPASSSVAASTGRCKSKRRRGMVKRHISHHAKRHFH